MLLVDFEKFHDLSLLHLQPRYVGFQVAYVPECLLLVEVGLVGPLDLLKQGLLRNALLRQRLNADAHADRQTRQTLLSLLLRAAILLLALVEVEERLPFLEHDAELLHLVCLLLRVELPLQGGNSLVHDPFLLLVQLEDFFA